MALLDPSGTGLSQSPDALRFDRAALVIGRPVYWGSATHENAAGILSLLLWCVGLPGVRLGISATNIANLVQDVFATLAASPTSQRRPTAAELRLLERFGDNTRPPSLWQPDEHNWEAHLEKLLGWLSGATPAGDFIWIDPADADWWIQATMQSIVSYAPLFGLDVSASFIARLISRHGCVVFAPFDGAATRDHLDRLVATLRSDARDYYERRLANPQFDRAQLATIHDACWSWRLLDFSNVDDSITCIPTLSFWSEWPASANWAPQLGASVTQRHEYTADEAAFLIETTFWQQLETLFDLARRACGLGVAEPEFAGVNSLAPVFFFAAPVDPPVRPEVYAENLRPAMMPLVRSCLLSTDPLAEQVGWGLVEGDMIALRRERSTRASNQPRYLLLPTFAQTPMRPLEDEVGSVAARLTYLEFSIAHEARDVYTDIEPLMVRRGLWAGTLDSVNTITGEAIDLLSSVHRSPFGRITDRLAALHMVVRRLQTSIETAASDTYQVDGTYSSYLDSTDNFLQRTVTTSMVPRVSGLNLRDAIQHAYPYQYVKGPLETLKSTMDQLSGEMGRISDSLNTILELSDRRLRRLSSQVGGIFSLILILLALLVSITQVLGAKTSPSATGTSATPVNFLDGFFQWLGLSVLARLLFDGVVVILFVLFIVLLIVAIAQRVPRRRHRFLEKLKRFRALVKAADVYAERASSEKDAPLHLWQLMDVLDEKAVQILADLWKDLRATLDKAQGRTTKGGMEKGPRRIRPQTVAEWVQRAHAVEHSMELFDLAAPRILLPRALFVLRYKSADFHSHTTVSDWDFGASLRSVEYSRMDIERLQTWLAELSNQRLIQDWDVATFARMLKECGVVVSPDKRTPDRWQGSLNVVSARARG